MTNERSAAHLRAIIHTQAEIAASDLDPKAIMRLIAEADRELLAAKDRLYSRDSFDQSSAK